MKKTFFLLSLSILIMKGMAQEIHYDFSVFSSTGYEMFYHIINEENHWVEITYPCQHGDNYYWGYDKPEGKLFLEDTITYQGTDYYLKAIGDHAFCSCDGLRGTLELPTDLRSIGTGAFKNCSNLNGSLNLPVSMKRIEDDAFSGCSSFSSSLRLPDSIQYVGDRAFLNCSSFTGILWLPASLATIGDEAFKGCTNTHSISVKMTTVPVTAPNAFDDIPSWIKVNVPYNMKEAYQNAPGWSRFANHIVEKSIWTGNAEPWTHGTGTEEDPFLIESTEHLAWLAKSVNERQNLVIDTAYSSGGAMYQIFRFYDVNAYQDTCFRLVVDLDFQKGTGLYWQSIGNVHYIDENNYSGPVFGPHYYLDVFNNKEYYFYATFCGNFDGNGQDISNYMMYDDFWDSKKDYNVQYRGLFGIVSNCNLCNFTINGLIIHSQQTNKMIGGLAGRAINTTFVNCHTSGLLRSGSVGWTDPLNTIGGVVGLAENCHIEKCTSSATIDACTQWNIDKAVAVGGIVGVIISDASSTIQSKIVHCHYEGTMKNLDHGAGGIVGLCDGADAETGTIKIENCYSKGSMTSATGGYTPRDSRIGGIVGCVASLDTLYIMNCYSNDTMIGNASNATNVYSYAGGIVAKAESTATLYIKNCYHVGPISSKYKGGILSQNTNMTLVRNCFFDQSTAPDDGFGVPLESDYMKTEAFVNQLNNGSTVFKMDTAPYENDGYPVFGTDGLIFTGAEWYYELLNPDGSITYQHLKCAGDTTIGNERPKIIVRTNTIYDKGEQIEITHEYVYEENGVVYWWNKTLNKFTTLYDFSAEMGDEWEMEVGETSVKVRVYEAENQIINGIPYKRMFIGDADDYFSGTLMSTIGHLTSFFPEKLMTKGFRVEGLRCYWRDGDLLLKVGEMDCDEIYEQYHHSVDDTDLADDIRIYPNPTNGLLHIVGLPQNVGLPQCDSPTGQTEYRITNIMGQTLLSGTVTKTIDVSMLPTGLYFITLGDQTLKFTKQ